jgi:hypothetical protein
MSSVLLLRATPRSAVKVDVAFRRRKRPHLYRFPELRSGMNTSDFIAHPKIKSCKASVRFWKKIFVKWVKRFSVLISVYVGTEVILLPQYVTDKSLSKCKLIYEGRQFSLQTTRHNVPGDINLRSQPCATQVNRPVWIPSLAEQRAFSRNTNTFLVLRTYLIISDIVILLSM